MAVMVAVATFAPATARALPAETVEQELRPAGPLGTYLVDSPFIRDRHGRVVFFHGVNAVWKRKPYHPPSSLLGTPRSKSLFDERDARFLASVGFNSVRLGVPWEAVEPEKDHFDTQYLGKMEEIADMLGRHGITVMVDHHQDMYNERYEGGGFPDWATIDDGVPATNCCGFPGNYFTPAVMRAYDNLYTNRDDLLDQFRDYWEFVARRFHRKPYLIGYDLFNEPWPGTQWPTCATPEGCPVFDARFLQPLFEHLIAGIRQHDRRNIIWWEPNVTNDFGAGNGVGLQHPIEDPASNQGISFHAYCLVGGNLIPGVSQKDDPACPIQEDLTFTQQHEAAERNSSGMFLTEFGASDDLVDVARMAAFADRHMVSWHYWHYGEWNDPTTTGTGGAQSLFENDRRRFQTIKLRKLKILARTYPRAIAGTPLSFSFDPEGPERAFSLVYESDPGVNAPTEIFVPVGVHYRNGYDVAIDGPARLLRSPDPRSVRVVNTGRGEVRITLEARRA